MNHQPISTLKDIINLLINNLMEDIPLIDLQPQFDNHAKETEIVKQIGEACENNGIFAVRGHGISEKVIEHCWQASHDFFDLADKLGCEKEVILNGI